MRPSSTCGRAGLLFIWPCLNTYCKDRKQCILSRFERHMKQEHEMYSNNMELILSIHFLTGEKGNKMVAIKAELKHIAIRIMCKIIVDEAISFSEPERVRLNERMQERKDKAREVIYNDTIIILIIIVTMNTEYHHYD